MPAGHSYYREHPAKAEKPPRPCNAWILFLNHYRNSLPKDASLRRNQTEVTRLASKQWEKLSEHERDGYYAAADLEKLKHEFKYPDYEYRPVRKEDKKRAPQDGRSNNGPSKDQNDTASSHSDSRPSSYATNSTTHPPRLYPTAQPPSAPYPPPESHPRSSRRAAQGHPYAQEYPSAPVYASPPRPGPSTATRSASFSPPDHTHAARRDQATGSHYPPSHVHPPYGGNNGQPYYGNNRQPYYGGNN